MAKKNIASLMSGLMGEPTSSGNDTSISSLPNKEEKTSEDSTKAGRRRPGRPRKGETVEPSNEIRATFIVNQDLIKKIKYISLVDDSLLKDVIDNALSEYIANWESENGEIRLPKGK